VLYRAANTAGPDNPGSTRSDPQSIAVFELASKLAGSEVEDDVARAELLRLAGVRRITLERAEKMSRLGRRHLELSERANRANRLLYAALHDVPVPAADPDQVAQIATLRKLFAKDRAPDEIWQQILATEPRLTAFLDDVQRGRFGQKFDAFAPVNDQHADPARGLRAYESLNGDLELAVELKRIVGPQAENTDVLVGSQRAYDFVHSRLLDERPAPESR
jgi:hypothetical protein